MKFSPGCTVKTKKKRKNNAGFDSHRVSYETLTAKRSPAQYPTPSRVKRRRLHQCLMSGVRELCGGNCGGCCEVVFVHMFLELRRKDWPSINTAAAPMFFTLQGALAKTPPSLVSVIWQLCLRSFYFLYNLVRFIFNFRFLSFSF